MGRRYVGQGVCAFLLLISLLGASIVIIPGPSVADQEGDYVYTTSDSPLVSTITRYIGAGGNITIPSALGGHPVVAIGSVDFNGTSAFSGCTSLVSVIIPGSVTSIGPGAFSHCTNMTSVTIPDNVTTIGDSAFSHSTSLASVTIGRGVTSIGNGSFANCTNLTSIIFLALSAPTGVGQDWIHGTDAGIRGHAFNSSDFPAPGGVWYGLTMGEALSEGDTIAGLITDSWVKTVVTEIAIILVLLAALLLTRRKNAE
jgi:hypothetical protein